MHCAVFCGGAKAVYSGVFEHIKICLCLRAACLLSIEIRDLVLNINLLGEPLRTTAFR